MEILPGFVANGCALFVKESKTLLLSDLHIGYEEEMRQLGVLIPREQKEQFTREIERLIVLYRPQTVVLAGDVKHELGRISQVEWSDVLHLIRTIRVHGCALEIVGGNHDHLIKPIIEMAGITLKKAIIITSEKDNDQDTVQKRNNTPNQENTKKILKKPTRTNQGDILIVHGDETIEALVEKGILERDALRRVSTIVMGHEHPALRMTDGVRTETTKCFLVGKKLIERKKRVLVVMPSFNPMTVGTDVLRERPLGPLLTAFGGFSAFGLVGEEILAFGSVEKLREHQKE